MISGHAYRRCSVRVPALTAENCRQLALQEGWTLFDLTRTLVTIGANATFLSLQEPEASGRFKDLTVLGEAHGMVSATLGKAGGREYAPRSGGPTDLLPLYLPKELSDRIGEYAKASHRTRNGVLAWFLVAGLLIYMTGTKALLETLYSLQTDLAKMRTDAKREAEKTEA